MVMWSSNLLEQCGIWLSIKLLITKYITFLLHFNVVTNLKLWPHYFCRNNQVVSLLQHFIDSSNMLLFQGQYNHFKSGTASLNKGLTNYIPLT